MKEKEIDNETHKTIIKNQRTTKETYDDSATEQDSAQKKSQNSMTKENIVYSP